MQLTRHHFTPLRAGAALALALVLAGCTGGGGGVDLSVSGDAAVGVSSSSGPSSGTVRYGGGLAGPPPGRTAEERQARKDYYRGPRGDEF